MGNAMNLAQMYLDAADVMIVVISAQEIVTEINQKGCEILGYRKDEIVGRNWFDNFLRKEIREEVRVLFHKVLERTIPLEHYENAVLTKDGSERIIAWHNLLLRDEAGAIIGTVSSGADITERKQAEERIAHLASFPELSPYPVLEVDATGTIQYLNPAARLVPRMENAGLKHPLLADVESAIEMPQPAKTAYVSREVEFQGRYYQRHIYAVPAQPDRLRIYMYDDTERKRAEEALRQSEERYRTLFESMDEGFALCEMIYGEAGKPVDFRYLNVNPAFARLTGLPVNRVIGRTARELIPHIEPTWIDSYTRVVESGISERIDNPVAELGKYYEVYAWRSGSGQFAVVFNDLTQRKQLEEELNRYRQRLEDVVTERTAESAHLNESLSRKIAEHEKAEAGLALRATILDNAGEAIFLLNANGDFGYANEAASNTYGYTREEFLGMNLRHLLRSQDAPEVEVRLEQLREKGYLELETLHLRKDKTPIPVSVCHTLIKTLHGHSIVSIIRNMTSEYRLRLLMERIPGILLVTDVELRLTEAMGAELETLGLRPGGGIGMTLFQYCKKNGLGREAPAAHRQALANTVSGYRIAKETPGNTYHGRARPLRDAQGGLCGTIGIIVAVEGNGHT